MVERKSYDEHAAMHYDCDGWSSWTEIYYDVKKCKACGGYHNLKM